MAPESISDIRVDREERPFTEEQEKEREKDRIREIEPILNELEEWRKNSLAASLRI